MTVSEVEASNVADRLRWLRLHFNLSRNDAASLRGANYSQWSNWETGFRRLSIDGALKLNAHFGVPLDFLYLGRMDTLPVTQRSSWVRYWSEVKQNPIKGQTE